jgi:hypothetical protein
MIFQYIVFITLFIVALADQTPFWIEDESSSNSRNLLNKFVDKDDEFVTAFAGITTFAHLPFINCLHPTYADEAKEKFDITIVGAPFDTSVTYRPGYNLPEFADVAPALGRLGLDWVVVASLKDSIQIVKRDSML